MKISLRRYEHEVKSLAKGGDDFCWSLGLGGEAGEVLDLIKKLHYHGGADKKGPITPNRILDECGDVLWYLTSLLQYYGFTLDDCMYANIQKLMKRHPNGWSHKTAQLHLDEKEDES